MAKKPTIINVASGYQSTTTINNNFENTKNAFDNTLSLDGSTPNAMQADIDMNSNDILNVNLLTTNQIEIDGLNLTTIASDVSADAASAEASKNSASSSASSSANSASNAASSASSAATSATTALVAKDTAVAAASATGPVLIYDTKSAADAALSSLSNLQIVEVMVDESRSNMRTRYRKESGSYVFKLVLSSTPMNWYVDSLAGSDSNDGFSPTSPLATLAGVTAKVRAGDTIWLRRGGQWRETLAPGKIGVIVDAYGSGKRPIVSGLDVVSTFLIEASGPAYTFTVDLPAGTVARSYAGVFEDGKRLKEYHISADGITDNAGVIAAVQANPGSFGFLSWSTNPTPGNPGGWTAGVKTYIVHASDSGNPGTNGKVYEVYKRLNVLQLGAGSTVRNIVFHQGWRHEVSDINDCTIERCAFLYAARHGTLPPQRVTIRDTVAALSNPRYQGAFFHIQAVTDGVVEPVVSYKDLTAIGNPDGFAAYGLYNHGTVGTTAIIKGFSIENARVENVATIYEFSAAQSVDINELNGYNFTTCGGPTGNIRITNGIFRSRTTQATARRQWNITTNQKIVLKNPYVDVVENSLFRTEVNSNIGTIEIEGGVLINRPAPISSDLTGLVLTESLNTYSIARLKVVDAIVYSNGPLLSRVSAVTSLDINRVLMIGHGARGNGNVTINGVTTPVSGVSGGGRVVTISDTKAVLSADFNDRLQLRTGVYMPGDEIFSSIVGSNYADNPRSYAAVGDSIVTFGGENLSSGTLRRGTPSAFLRSICLVDAQAVTVGDSGEIWRTTDAYFLTWVRVTGTGITANLLAVAGRSTGVVVAVGAGGVIYRSTDFGATWTSITSPTTRTMRAIVSNGATWVAAGDEGRVITSADDGLTWTEATVGTAAHRALIRFNSLYVLGSDPVLGATSLTSNIRTSSDAVTWTERANGVPNSVSCFAVTVEGLIAGVQQTSSVSAASFMTSTDGTTWVVEDTILPFEVTGLAATGSSGRYEQRPIVAVGESAHFAVRRANGQAWDIRRGSTAFPAGITTSREDVLTSVTAG